MMLAMQMLGFVADAVHWKDPSTFIIDVLPKIRCTLCETGPIYASFRPNIFGAMGHVCVIVGYDDRKEEINFYNPRGNKFEKTYQQVAIEASGLVLIETPKTEYVVNDAFTAIIGSRILKCGINFLNLSGSIRSIATASQIDLVQST